MDITGRKLFVKALMEEGVDTIFGYPGGTVTDLFDELYKTDEINLILPRHEQGLIHEAEGYAKSTGKTGVVLVTSGPGATNIITGLADAHYDNVPLVCFTGQVPLNLIGNDAFQEVDIVGMTRSITKYGVTVRRREDLGKINRNWAKEYLKQWAKAKYRLYKLLGDKLKVEKDVEVEPSPEEFRIMQQELACKFPLYAPIIKNVYYGAFVRDCISHGDLWEDAYSDKRITNGMSLTKFFALLGSEELNVELSKMYQNKGKAHLTISIDPNDYLTVSINSSGWRSCHNFIDGEWRNAGLSYMVDEVSMVSYKSNGEVKYRINGENFNRNSKNWRQDNTQTKVII